MSLTIGPVKPNGALIRRFIRDTEDFIGKDLAYNISLDFDWMLGIVSNRDDEMRNDIYTKIMELRSSGEWPRSSFTDLNLNSVKLFLNTWRR